MQGKPKNQFSFNRTALNAFGAKTGNLLSDRSLRLTHIVCVLIALLALSRTALAQIEPALPGSIEYSLITNNETWVLSPAPITTGIYVYDLLTDRLNQPTGRGEIGIVTSTSFDPDYNEMAATVDFGRNYSAGIVFPELSAIQLVPAPEPSTLLVLPAGVLFWRAALSRRRRTKATS